MKKYVIYAGVNGAGKSTMYRSFPHEELPRINTDEMVSAMGSWQDASLQAKAGVIDMRFTSGQNVQKWVYLNP